MKNLPNKSTQLGLSLVELLVSMVISGIILAGVARVMLDGKSNFLLEQEVSYIQENARFVVDELGYEIRMAGYTGCNGNGRLTNTLNNSTTAANWMYSSNGIKGYTEGQAGLPAEFAAAATGTDILVINRGEPDDSVQVSSHVPASSEIHLTNSQPFEKGQILVVASEDCENMSVFQMSGPNSTNPSHIGHSTGGSVNPGNCRKALSLPGGAPYDCDSMPSPSEQGMEFPPGSSIMKFKSTGYYISESALTGVPTLYRSTLVIASDDAVPQAQELLSGVEKMSILYGVDTTANAIDGVIDRYLASTSITLDEATSGSGWIGWDRVLTARVTLIMRSSREIYSENTVVDLGDGDTYNDKYMRQKVRTTTLLRNRGVL